MRSITLLSSRSYGVMLVLISVVVFSFAGLFVRSVDADAWTIIFWRGLFSALSGIVHLWVAGRGSGTLLDSEFVHMGSVGWAAAIVAASGSAAFIPAFQLTSIANVSLIYAITPLIAAFLMWVWIKERPAKSMLLASIAALGGVLIIVSGSIGKINIRGDLLALWMSLAMAGFMCIYRRYPGTPVVGPTVVSSLLLLPCALYWGESVTASAADIAMLAIFGLAFTVASVTLGEGARRLPASETALLSALETPLAPIWAILIFMEFPPMMTLIGGAIILVAIVASEWHEMGHRK